MYSVSDATWEAYLCAFHKATPRASTLAHELFADPRGKTSYARFVGILERMPSPSKLAVLDLGSGDGRLVDHIRLLTGDAARIDAVDLVPEEIERAGAWGRKANFVTGRAQSLPFEDAAFDAVLSHFAFGYMMPVEPVVGEIERVLRPQGFFATLTTQRGSARDDLAELLTAFHAELDAAAVVRLGPAPSDPQNTPAGIASLFAAAGSTRVMRNEAVQFMATPDADGAWLYLTTQYFFDELGSEARKRLRDKVDALASRRHGRLQFQVAFDFVAMVPKIVERSIPR